MPKDVGNLLQAGPGHAQLGRRRPSQDMRATVPVGETGADEGQPDGMSYRFGRDRCIEWRLIADKHGVTRTRPSSLPQVGRNGSPGEHGQGQDVGPTRFPSANADGAVPPIQIVELQGDDLTHA